MPSRKPSDELIERWRSGEETAAEELHRRYAQRLLALAEKQIGNRLGRRVGADDIVQSVFQTFFRRTADGEYSIDHADALWRLLVRITLNKIRKQGAHHGAAKRDVATEVHGDDSRCNPMSAACAPDDQDGYLLLDELQTLMSGLPPPEPEILRLKLEGYSTSEIAGQLRCSRWTVRRVLNRIGRQLEGRLEDSSAT